MKAVRFRCPKCQTQHSAIAARAGQAFVCKTCFGPLIVPGVPESPSTEIPIASSIPRIEEPVREAAIAKPQTARKRPSPIEPPTPYPMEVEPELSGMAVSKSKTSPSLRVGKRSMIAAAVLMVAAVGVVVGLHRLRSERTNQLMAMNDQVIFEAEVLPVAPIEPQPAIEVEPPAPLVEPVVAPEPPPAPVVNPASLPSPNDPNRPLVIRHRQKLDQEALRRQLAELPELGATNKTEAALVALHQVIPPGRLGRSAASALSLQEREQLRRAALAEQRKKPRNPSAPLPDDGPPRTAMRVAREEGAPLGMLAMIQDKQPELTALPWRMGDECHLGRESAEDLQIVSRALRTLLAQSTPQGDTRPDANLLRAALLAEPAEEEVEAQGPLGQSPTPQQRRRATNNNRTKFVTPAAIPALQQLLMAERTPVRQVLVDVLDKIQCREAAKGLAKLAMFDLAPEVRERALLALRARSTEDYRPSLVEGLRYPWAPVADHAAEALVALGDREAISDLVALLDKPDPAGVRTELRDGKPVTLATSLVQVNHLQNCVLCHAPSGDATKDFVRGRVPDETQPLPPPVEYYANSSPGLFVRADVTYLRQDFSVTQPVDQPGPWPAYQRYDYLITEKPASRWSNLQSLDNSTEYPQRESVLFALRELTGRDLGTRSSDWKTEVKGKSSAE